MIMFYLGGAKNVVALNISPKLGIEKACTCYDEEEDQKKKKMKQKKKDKKENDILCADLNSPQKKKVKDKKKKESYKQITIDPR